MPSVKTQRVNIFHFVGHTVPVKTTAQLCCQSMKVATGDTYMKTNGHGCISIKADLAKQALEQVWPTIYS